MMNIYQSTTSWPGAQVQLESMPQLAEVRAKPFPVVDEDKLNLTRPAHTVQAISREDDWTGIKDAARRRKAQTRLNTRAYRKRKAMTKNPILLNAAPDRLGKSEVLVECWDFEIQSVCTVPASHAKQLYDSRIPLLQDRPRTQQLKIMFPLCPDHLITLLQFNALRALAVNRTLISGTLVTPLDCANEEIIHIVPYPSKPELLPIALLPTTLQQMVPHPDWIDMFPSPEGRDRLIRAMGLFDEDDLWADCIGGLYEGFPDDEITRRGIVAWSPPWDITGWEMSEGFLKKWGWIFSELPGALESTNRWRGERGEEPLVYGTDHTSGALVGSG